MNNLSRGVFSTGSNDSKVCTLEKFDCYTQAIYQHFTEALESTSDKGDYIDLDLTGSTNSTKLMKNVTETSTTEPVSTTDESQVTTDSTSKPTKTSTTESTTTDQSTTESKERMCDSGKFYWSDDSCRKETKREVKVKCNCLPSCNSFNYVSDYRTSTFVGDVLINYQELPIG